MGSRWRMQEDERGYGGGVGSRGLMMQKIFCGAKYTMASPGGLSRINSPSKLKAATNRFNTSSNDDERLRSWTQIEISSAANSGITQRTSCQANRCFNHIHHSISIDSVLMRVVKWVVHCTPDEVVIVPSMMLNKFLSAWSICDFVDECLFFWTQLDIYIYGWVDSPTMRRGCEFSKIG